MRIALVNEAWHPQVNGVVTTWTQVTNIWRARGHDVKVLHPELFSGFACPGYPSVRIAAFPGPRLQAMLDDYQPDAIHIATEGTLGGAAKAYCQSRGLPFTTSYHTQFADYLKKYFHVPKAWSYAYMARFHNAAERVLVPTETLRARLEKRGFRNLVVWTRGVDMQMFRPAASRSTYDLPRPIFLYAGRVAIEKNIDAFLAADLPGSKVVMGTGPAIDKLRARFPEATFLGYQPPEAFARYMAGADVMVFPSRTDTFGVVMLEALASGVPVAAYPVTGPLDVLDNGRSGVMHEDLRQACLKALDLKPDDCRDHAARYPWDACAAQAFENLAPISVGAV